MESDSGIFDIEVFCNICGSDNVEISYNTSERCLIMECECGVADKIYVEEI